MNLKLSIIFLPVYFMIFSTQGADSLNFIKRKKKNVNITIIFIILFINFFLHL